MKYTIAERLVSPINKSVVLLDTPLVMTKATIQTAKSILMVIQIFFAEIFIVIKVMF